MKRTVADLTGVIRCPPPHPEELSSLHNDRSNRVLLYGVVIKEDVGRRGIPTDFTITCIR